MQMRAYSLLAPIL